MTDFRALCAELLNSLGTLYKQSVTAPYNQMLEIGGVTHAIPIGNDIMVQDSLYGHLIARARAAVDDTGGTGASVEQVAQIVYENAMLATAPDHAKPHWPNWAELPNSDARTHALNTAEIILTRWGRPAASAVEPIPVSERLPKDTDHGTSTLILLQVGASCGGGAHLTPDQCHCILTLLATPLAGP